MGGCWACGVCIGCVLGACCVCVCVACVGARGLQIAPRSPKRYKRKPKDLEICPKDAKMSSKWLKVRPKGLQNGSGCGQKEPPRSKVSPQGNLALQRRAKQARGAIFGPILEPKATPKSSKTEPKADKIRRSCFVRFVIPFWTKLRPKIGPIRCL